MQIRTAYPSPLFMKKEKEKLQQTSQICLWESPLIASASMYIFQSLYCCVFLFLKWNSHYIFNIGLKTCSSLIDALIVLLCSFFFYSFFIHFCNRISQMWKMISICVARKKIICTDLLTLCSWSPSKSSQCDMEKNQIRDLKVVHHRCELDFRSSPCKEAE